MSVLLDFIDSSFYIPQALREFAWIQPVASHQTFYYIINQVNAPWQCASLYGNHFFGISSTENNTIIVITTPNNDSYSLSLDLHDTYSEIAENNTIELTGYTVSSSAPVTVVSGNLCTFNTVGSSDGLGTYISNQTPETHYGYEYIVPNIQAPRNSGYDVYVVASRDGTTVYIDDSSYSISEGELITEKFPGKTTPTQVVCSLPCGVVQFTRGYTTNDGLFMMNIVPTTEFYFNATFTTSEDSNPFYITVIVDSPTAVTDLLLDGVAFLPAWTVFGKYTHATAKVSRGFHVMSATQSQYALYTYAHTGGWGGGYGYAVHAPTGLDIHFSICPSIFECSFVIPSICQFTCPSISSCIHTSIVPTANQL